MTGALPDAGRADLIRNSSVRTPPCDLSDCNQWASLPSGAFLVSFGHYESGVDPATGWATAYADASIRTQWPQPNTDATADAFATVGFAVFGCLRMGEYEITTQGTYKGTAGLYIPTGNDFWGGNSADVTITLRVEVTRNPTSEVVVAEDHVLYSDSANYAPPGTHTWSATGPFSYTLRMQGFVGELYAVKVKLSTHVRAGGVGGTGTWGTDWRDAHAWASMGPSDFVGCTGGDRRGIQLTSVQFADLDPDLTPPSTTLSPAGDHFCGAQTVYPAAFDCTYPSYDCYGVERANFLILGGPYQIGPAAVWLEDDAIVDYRSFDFAGNAEDRKAETYTITRYPVPPAVSARANCQPILLSWDAVADAAEYRVFRDGALLAETTERAITDPAPPGTRRCYRVVTVNECGMSDSSAVGCAQTAEPAAPVLVGIPNGRTGASQPVTLRWQAVPGAQGYHLQLASDPEMASLVFDQQTGGTSLEVPLMPGGSNCYWRVACTDGVCWSPWSPTWNFQTALGTYAQPEVPSCRFAVDQNFPNPFNPRTTIAFELPSASSVTVEFFDAAGQRVCTALRGELPAGRHAVSWSGVDDDGLPVASGLYLYRVSTPRASESRPMVLLR